MFPRCILILLLVSTSGCAAPLAARTQALANDGQGLTRIELPPSGGAIAYQVTAEGPWGFVLHSVLTIEADKAVIYQVTYFARNGTAVPILDTEDEDFTAEPGSAGVAGQKVAPPELLPSAPAVVEGIINRTFGPGSGVLVIAWGARTHAGSDRLEIGFGGATTVRRLATSNWKQVAETGWDSAAFVATAPASAEPASSLHYGSGERTVVTHLTVARPTGTGALSLSSPSITWTINLQRNATDDLCPACASRVHLDALTQGPIDATLHYAGGGSRPRIILATYEIEGVAPFTSARLVAENL